MRLTAGSFRELHWHTADEWSIMLYGNARVTCLNPDGTVLSAMWAKVTCGTFQQDSLTRSRGWKTDGCEFILVFDQGSFSEDNTFLLSDWVRRTPPSVLSKNFGLPASALKNLPNKSLYIFPADLPASLHKTSPPLGGVVSNHPTNTPSEWSYGPTKGKRVVVQFASLTRVTSWRRKILLQPWSPLSRVVCANCIGIQTASEMAVLP